MSTPNEQKYLQALRKVYPHTLDGYWGSPYEGEGAKDHIELILHELGHNALLPAGAVRNFDAIDALLKGPNSTTNRHEIMAAAIEIKVARLLKINIRPERLAWTVLKNLRSGRPGRPWRPLPAKWTEDRVYKAILRASKLRSTERKAREIVSQVNQHVG